MILSFKEQFNELIKDGTKKHSIRKGNRWKDSYMVQFWNKSRSKNRKQIMPDKPCTGVQSIQIKFAHRECEITIDGKSLPRKEHLTLAVNDGFPGTNLFYKFFRDNYGDEFSGQIIHWHKMKY